MIIYCVEDDQSIRDLEVYTLSSTGFEAKGFSCGEELFGALQSETPSLIILDIMLPKTDGVEILKILKSRRETQKIPVIMATAKGLEYDKIQSLDLGADDYLVKPFGMLEMVARVKAVLRRSASDEKKEVYRVGSLTLNVSERTVSVGGRRITLTYKEFELLRLFMAHVGTVFTREQLFAEIWGQDYIGETRTVDSHIRTLRQKIEPCGEFIKTVRNVGYRLEEDI